MKNDLGLFSFRRRKLDYLTRCDCEPLETRVALSASSALPAELLPTDTVAVAALPSGLPTVGSLTSIAFPGGVTVTPTQIITPNDTIPRFAANPTISSTASGDWNNPATWSLGRVPTDHDRVVIAANTQVTFATVATARLDALEIDGSLVFSSSANTRLIAGNITVMPNGTLQIGSPSAPIAAGVKAEVIIADQPLDPVNDPNQFGTGILGFGTVTVHGATINQTWDRLATEPRAGDTVLVLADAISWKAGDTLVLPDTRQVSDADDKRFPAGLVSSQTEQVTVRAVAGNRVYLSAPLLFDHLGAHGVSGDLTLLPHVAHLDHNVVIRSENPAGNRGHIFFTARANVDIEYAQLQDLGRTDAFAALDDTQFDASGNVTHFGANQEGRYSVNFADLLGPNNPTNTGYQFKFIGNTVDGARRYGVALENTSFGLVQQNVVYDAQGAGFVTEEGTEIGNVFDRNLTVNIVGTHGDGKDGTLEDDYGRGGSGFWFRRGGNTVTGNVAADSTYAGFVYDGYATDQVTLPVARGVDPSQPGGGTTTYINPTAPFDDNEAYGMTTFGVWAAFISGDNLIVNQPTTVFHDLRLWNIWTAGVMAYHTADTTFDGLTMYGDKSAQVRNDAGTVGMELQLYENRNVIVRNSHIEGVRIGIYAPRNDASQAGAPQPTVIENSTLYNYINISVTSPMDNRPSNGNALVVRDVKFALDTRIATGPAPASSVNLPANIQLKAGGDSPNLTQPSTVTVYDYNQIPGLNFQVYYKEQKSNYVMPQTSIASLSGTQDGIIGSPEAGLTNAQNWTKYKIAVAGAVAPANALASRPEINGLVAPIANPLAVTPSAVLVTPWNNVDVGAARPLRVRYNVNGVLPDGAQVYFSMDGSTPVTQLTDSVVYNLIGGTHRLLIFIGDSRGRALAGTGWMVRTFTVDAPIPIHIGWHL